MAYTLQELVKRRQKALGVYIPKEKGVEPLQNTLQGPRFLSAHKNKAIVKGLIPRIVKSSGALTKIVIDEWLTYLAKKDFKKS